MSITQLYRFFSYCEYIFTHLHRNIMAKRALSRASDDLPPLEIARLPGICTCLENKTCREISLEGRKNYLLGRSQRAGRSHNLQVVKKGRERKRERGNITCVRVKHNPLSVMWRTRAREIARCIIISKITCCYFVRIKGNIWATRELQRKVVVIHTHSELCKTTRTNINTNNLISKREIY